MQTEISLILRVKYQKLQDKMQKVYNDYFRELQAPITARMERFRAKVALILGEDFQVFLSSTYVTVKYTKFKGEYPYQRNREIASICLRENFITFRFAEIFPRSVANRRFRYTREITPEKFTREIRQRIIARIK